MPNYPSSFISGTAPGERSVNNITDNREIKNITVNTIGQAGPYPTDQSRGTTDLTDSTATIEDFDTVIQTLETEINAYQAAIATTSAIEKDYIANALSLTLVTLTQKAEEFAFALNRLTEDVSLIDTKGSLPASRYPSGWNRGY
jgi:hypothetical protein